MIVTCKLSPILTDLLLPQPSHQATTSGFVFVPFAQTLSQNILLCALQHVPRGPDTSAPSPRILVDVSCRKTGPVLSRRAKLHVIITSDTSDSANTADTKDACLAHVVLKEAPSFVPRSECSAERFGPPAGRASQVQYPNHRPLEKPRTFALNYHVNLLRWKVSIALESFHRFHNFMPSRPMGSSLGFQCHFRWVFNVLFAEF